MLDLNLELVIGGYLMLEYSLSFSLFLCTATHKNKTKFLIFTLLVRMIHLLHSKV